MGLDVAQGFPLDDKVLQLPSRGGDVDTMSSGVQEIRVRIAMRAIAEGNFDRASNILVKSGLDPTATPEVLRDQYEGEQQGSPESEGQTIRAVTVSVIKGSFDEAARLLHSSGLNVEITPEHIRRHRRTVVTRVFDLMLGKCDYLAAASIFITFPQGPVSCPPSPPYSAEGSVEEHLSDPGAPVHQPGPLLIDLDFEDDDVEDEGPDDASVESVEIEEVSDEPDAPTPSPDYSRWPSALTTGTRAGPGVPDGQIFVDVDTGEEWQAHSAAQRGQWNERRAAFGLARVGTQGWRRTEGDRRAQRRWSQQTGQRVRQRINGTYTHCPGMPFAIYDETEPGVMDGQVELCMTSRRGPLLNSTWLR